MCRYTGPAGHEGTQARLARPSMAPPTASGSSSDDSNAPVPSRPLATLCSRPTDSDPGTSRGSDGDSTWSSAQSGDSWSHSVSVGSSRFSSDESTVPSISHWDLTKQTRGRTHYTWMLQQFDPLLAYLPGQRSGEVQSEGRAYTEQISHSPPQSSSNDTNNNERLELWDELPAKAVTVKLIHRFFDTIARPYGILNSGNFWQQYETMCANPRAVKICFVIEVLLVVGLANATLPADSQPLSRESTANWLALASSMLATAMDLRDFDIETIRLWALINLHRQMLRVDDVADYVYTASTLHAGILVGLNHPATWNHNMDRYQLWEALVELNLQASLSAGLPPSLSLDHASLLPPKTENEEVRSPALSNADLTKVLRRSRSIRHKIITLLNSEVNLHYNTIADLDSGLTEIMGQSVGSAPTVSGEGLLFHFRAVSACYHKTLAALHRPFSLSSAPALHYSRRLSAALAINHIQSLNEIHSKRNADVFDRLVSERGGASIARAFNSLLTICSELYRPAPSFTVINLLDISGREEHSMLGILEEYLRHAESSSRWETHTDAYRAAYMTIKHCSLREQFEVDSKEYQKVLTEHGKALW